MKNALSRFVVLTALSTAPLACSEPAAPAPESLGDVRVPSDFTFATTRPVALTVSAAAERVGPGFGALTIARLDGKVLFRGPIGAEEPVALRLMVPTKDSEVEVTLSAREGEEKRRVDVSRDATTHVFE